MNSSTVNDVLERARDVDVNVRKMLYRKIQVEFTDIDSAPAEKIIELIKLGLNER